MVAAGLMTAQIVAAKAARDALFLANFDVTSLPAVVIVTSIFSIALAILSGRVITRLSPAFFVPMIFAFSAGLFLLEWGLFSYSAPLAGVMVLYFHLAAIGPMLGSGFWLVATERFDPRAAKKNFGQIGGVGTLGGLIGALIAERSGTMLGAASVLPILAGLSLGAGWSIRRLAGSQSRAATSAITDPELAPEPPQPGLKVLRQEPYLRSLAALVLLGTLSSGLLDYVFKVDAVATFGRGEPLLRFFALYYAATSILTFVVQATAGGYVMRRWGLSIATSTPSLALLGGSLVGLVAPGFA